MEDLKLLKGSFLICLGYSFHRIHIEPHILQSSFGVDDGRNVSGIVRHDLAEQHVLQFEQRFGIVQCAALIKGLIEIRVGSFVVMLLGMQQTRLRVNLRIQLD